ncbi:MAG: hypothetical protein V7700_15725 [Halioglobus sp.]
MEYFRLTIGLLLPWLGGYLWLAALKQWLNPGKPNNPLLIGYGLFFGYAGLQGVVLTGNALFDKVEFWPILAFVCLVTAAGAIVLSKTRAPSSPDTGFTVAEPDSSTTKALFWLFAAWASLHLLFVAIEILHRPVFPWDAWLNWMYRAKAWFYTGHIFVLDSPTDWLRGTGEALYNVAGNRYPTFAPVLALWAATSLGYWSETLTNIPVLFCGIALGLALYGQCREFGLAKWLSALCAYLLLSLPLVGAHLALAGQSDIWMAGFTGLGFVALLHGIIRHSRFQSLLGLGMVAMGIATKMEGMVWFIAALLVVALTKRLGLVLAGLALAAGIAALGWLTDVTYLELPFLGGIGYADGRFHIPLLGSHALQSFELWDDYQDNFFENGTWHLLWTLTLVAAISLWFTPGGALRKAALAFYAVLLAAQLVIFEGTASGQWAEDWTAINRLPLHFAPALTFLLAIVLHAFWGSRKDSPATKFALLAPLLGLLITLAGATIYLMAAYPATAGDPLVFPAQKMRIMAGGGRVAGDVGIIEHYENNIAILSTGPVQLQAKDLGILQLETADAYTNRFTFFWRNGADPEDLHSTEIPGGGKRWINLGDLPQWQGRITELGVIFYAHEDETAEFYRLTLSPYSLALQLRKLTHNWLETSRWSQKSVHWIPAGAGLSSIPLPALMGAWVLLTVVMVTLFSRRKTGAYLGALTCAFVAWTLLDLRWTFNGIAQANDTIGTYPLVTATHMNFGDDQYTWQLVEAVRPAITNNNSRTIIMAEQQTMRFEALRAKYLALPAPVFAHDGTAQSAPFQIANKLLVLRTRYAEPGYKHATAKDYAGIIDQQTGLLATPLWDKPEGILMSITPDNAPVQSAK